jgi:rhodanese-related sulfurtransferase
MTQLKTISPERAAKLVREGAVMIDVRGGDEHARERIPGARHHALTRIDTENPLRAGDDVVIFHCRTGARTSAHAAKLAASASECEAYILEGGIDAWKTMGLPIALDARQPIEMHRQVQIAAGALILLGALLGMTVHPALYALSAFIGAGLVFAGITGWCGMANILGLMPWNRTASVSASAR